MPVLYFFIIMLLMACKNTHPVADDKNIQTIIVDPGLITEPEAVSSVFDSILFIPLETTGQSRFAHIDRLQVTDQYFIITDKTLNCILFFKKDGSFHHKICDFGQLATAIYTPATHEREHTLVVDDNKAMKLLRTSTSGKKLDETDYPFPYLYMTEHKGFRYFFNGNRAYNKGDNSRMHNLIITDTANNIRQRFFPYDTTGTFSDDLFDTANNFFISNGDLIFAMPYYSSFYKLRNDQVTTTYKLILPDAYRLPENFLHDSSLRGSREAYLTDQNGGSDQVWNCTDIFQTSNGIFSFKLQSMNNLDNTMFYNPATQNMIRMKNLGSDKKVYYLPVFENKIYAAWGDYFYSAVSAKLLFQSILISGKTNALNENQKLTAFFEKGSNMSNPVIITLKPKFF